MDQARKKLIISLDVPSLAEAEELVDILDQDIDIFKIGLELFINSGIQSIEMLRKKEKRIFLDLKMHDLPKNIIHATKVLIQHDVNMFSIHAAGGKKMMQAAAETVVEAPLRPLVLAVTVLPSIQDVVGMELQSKLETEELVIHWAKMAKEAGLDGVVASPWETEKIKKECGDHFKVVCPGVRPIWSVPNNSFRFFTPRKAIKHGADAIVIGGPITRAKDPKTAAERVLEEIAEAIV